MDVPPDNLYDFHRVLVSQAGRSGMKTLQTALKMMITLVVILAVTTSARATPEQPADWTTLVREAPYWVSQGVYSNITTIRRWVLAGSGYCADTERHVLFGLRGHFLGYIDNAGDRKATQAQLNQTRADLAREGRVDAWVPGDETTTGYPFALACDQPHVNLDESIARYLGTIPSEQIWGTWDDLAVGSENDTRSLHEALMTVYQTRLKQNRLDLPPELPRYLAGQILIESGGQQMAHSAAGARGILQLSASVLDDCDVEPDNYWHRLAQIDCALKLMNQNARNLRPVFEQRFGMLPDEKRDRLFTLLLIQAYHGGVGRVEALLQDEMLSRPADYFARNQQQFSAGDIAFGLIFHNLGRDRFGLASLYYVADVQLATEALCNRPRLKGSDFCR